ncbi:hypothetical protein ABBQ38_003006 [Trebouxia sp. C0009 RCD-2024]
MRQAFRVSTPANSYASSFSTGNAPSLKTQIRELYKRIHPDKFHGFPPARDANEKSFKMLQEYLAVAKEGDQGTAALPYHFVFYLHQAHAQRDTFKPPQPSAAPHTEPVPNGLHKISLTLPPPARKDYAQPDQLPAATQASIGRLLSACGLQGEVEGGLGSEQANKRLRLFVPAAAELSRQREATQLGPKHQLSMVRAALRLGRQVTVGLSNSLQQKSADVQAGILGRLVAALDRTPEVELAGMHIMIGEEGYGPDKQGRLWLHADASAALWSQYLKQADLAECGRQKQVIRRIRDLEATAAQRVGVSMVYTTSQLQQQPAYLHFLQRLADGAATQGPVGDPALREVPVQVIHGGTAEAEAAGEPDAERTHVAVSVTASLEQVYRAIKAHGLDALKALRRQKAERQRLEDFRNSVERRLRLRRLMRDERLQDAQFISCCKRMLFNADSLAQLVEGLSLRISYSNQVAPEGTYIDIAWDFEV